MPKANEPKVTTKGSPRVTRAAAPSNAPEIKVSEKDGVVTAEYIGFKDPPPSRGRRMAREMHEVMAEYGVGPLADDDEEREEEDMNGDTTTTPDPNVPVEDVEGDGASE